MSFHCLGQLIKIDDSMLVNNGYFILLLKNFCHTLNRHLFAYFFGSLKKFAKFRGKMRIICRGNGLVIAFNAVGIFLVTDKLGNLFRSNLTLLKFYLMDICHPEKIRHRAGTLFHIHTRNLQRLFHNQGLNGVPGFIRGKLD